VNMAETASNREFVRKNYGACNQLHIVHRHPTAIHFRSVCSTFQRAVHRAGVTVCLCG
jgi:hypothetical protein